MSNLRALAKIRCYCNVIITYHCAKCEIFPDSMYKNSQRLSVPRGCKMPATSRGHFLSFPVHLEWEDGWRAHGLVWWEPAWALPVPLAPTPALREDATCRPYLGKRKPRRTSLPTYPGNAPYACDFCQCVCLASVSAFSQCLRHRIFAYTLFRMKGV